MSIVIMGASGLVGGAVATRLLAFERAIVAVSSDQNTRRQLEARGATILDASVFDTEALVAAFRAATAAFVMLPAPVSVDLAAFQSDAIESLEKVIRESGIPHVVLLSSVGAHLEAGTGSIVGLNVAERVLSAIESTRVTIVRAPLLVETLTLLLGEVKTGVFRSPWPPSARIELAAATDVASVVVEALVGAPPSATRILEVGGQGFSPQALAALLTTVVRRPVTVRTLGAAEYLKLLKASGYATSRAAPELELAAALGTGQVRFENRHEHAGIGGSVAAAFHRLLSTPLRRPRS